MIISYQFFEILFLKKLILFSFEESLKEECRTKNVVLPKMGYEGCGLAIGIICLIPFAIASLTTYFVYEGIDPEHHIYDIQDLGNEQFRATVFTDYRWEVDNDLIENCMITSLDIVFDGYTCDDPQNCDTEYIKFPCSTEYAYELMNTNDNEQYDSDRKLVLYVGIPFCVVTGVPMFIGFALAGVDFSD